MIYLPFFFVSRIFSASSVYPAAIMPSLTSRLISRAVSTSTTSLTAIKSPNEESGSQLRALTKAVEQGVYRYQNFSETDLRL